MKHFDRKVSLHFTLVSEGIVPKSVGKKLSPCEGQNLMMTSLPHIRCGVASDGSSLVIDIDPAPPSVASASAAEQASPRRSLIGSGCSLTSPDFRHYHLPSGD